ncbi:MAG: uroporphyrinogen-III synthase [Alphaproteobacteria bacterium]
MARPIALVTRPWEDAEPLAHALQSQGYRPVVEPLLGIEDLHTPLRPPDDLQAIAVTSTNGVRALARRAHLDLWHVPVFTVGDASARAARAAGFRHVTSAAGDVAALARCLVQNLDPAAGPVLHVSGANAAGDLAGRLAGEGFDAKRVALYRAEPARRLSEAARALFRARAVALALFFSPRTGETFVRLANRDEIGPDCAETVALCLSPAVAKKISILPWRAVVIADKPDQDSLLTEAARLANRFHA